MVDQHTQRLLFDTDAFCKLGIAGLLPETISYFESTFAECGRLPALHYMLSRGGLRRKIGDLDSQRLVDLAKQMPVALEPHEKWVGPLVNQPFIDPGEALLLATAAEKGCLIITGDKRGLLGIKDLPEYTVALEGRVVVLEALLTSLAFQLGEDVVRARVAPLCKVDAVTRICFANVDISPTIGLMSYFNDLVDTLDPLKLWSPLVP